MIVLHRCRGREHSTCPGYVRRAAPAKGFAVCACSCHRKLVAFRRFAMVVAGLLSALDYPILRRDHEVFASLVRDALERPYRHLFRKNAAERRRAREKKVSA